MSRATKIKRCPACGAKPPVVATWYAVADARRVECARTKGGCGLVGPWATGQSEDAAIAAWNALPRRKHVKRKAAEAAIQRLVDAQGILISAAERGEPGSVAKLSERNDAWDDLLRLMGHEPEALE